MPADGVALDRQLAEQNNQRTLWIDCEAHGLRHQLLAPEPVVGTGGDVRSPLSSSRRCRRCPVRILTVR